jgi:hypothetical protein
MLPGVWNVATMGLRSVAYEGGPSFDYTGNGEAAKASAWSDPRMKTSIVAHHDAWSSFGGDLLVYYTAARNDGNWYQWAFTHSIHDLATPKLQGIDQLRSQQRAAVTVGHAIPSTVGGNQYHQDSTGYGNPGTGSIGLSASQRKWVSYAIHGGSGSTATVTLRVSGASSGAQVRAYWNGVLLGTQAASGGTVTFGPVDVNPRILHGLVVRAASGSFSLDSVALQ